MAVPVIGRDREVERLQAALRAAAEASAGVLLLGESGVGKTTLLGEFINRVGSSATTLTCRGLPGAGIEVPYAPVVQLLRGAARDHPVELRRWTTERARASLADLVPDVFAPADASGGAYPVHPVAAVSMQRLRLLTAMIELLSGLAQTRVVLLAVDDLQWVDDATLSLLSLVLRGEPPAGVLLAMTLRDPGAPDAIRRWCATERRSGAIETLRLAPLDLEQSAMVLRSLLSSPPEPGRVKLLHRLSGGNPYLLSELATGIDTGVPDSVHEIVRSDLDELTEPARSVVAVLAVAGRSVPAPVVVSIFGELGLRAADEAMNGGLVVPAEEGSYGFRHDISRLAVVGLLSPGELLTAHAALGEALALSLSGESADRADAALLGEVAWHLDQGDRPTSAAGWALRAADAAEAMGAFEVTHRQLERVLDCTARSGSTLDPVDELVLRRRAAVGADRAGAHDLALGHVDHALGLVDDVEQRSMLLAHKGWLLVTLGRAPEGLAYAEEAVQRLPDDAAPAVEIDVLLGLAVAYDMVGNRAGSGQLATRALDIATITQDSLRVGRAKGVLAGADPCYGDQTHAIALLEEAYRSAVELADVDALVLSAVSLTDRLLVTGRLTSVVDLAEETERVLATVAKGEHWLAGMVSANAASALVELARWPEAELRLERSLDDDVLGLARVIRAHLRVQQGDLLGARQDLDRCTGLRRHDEPALGLDYDVGNVALLIAEGDASRALAESLDAMAAFDDEILRERGAELCHLGARAAADAQRSQHPVSGARSTALLEHVARAHLGEGFDELVRGELARLAGTPSQAHFAAAAQTWQDRRPYRSAYALWREAEALLESRGSRPTAAGALVRAARVVRGLGAVPLLHEIQDLARRARIDLDDDPGAAAVTAKPDLAGGLTARERAVLELLAEGRTNREIGEILYMSPKTASVHVSSIIRKLGVRSRVHAAGLAHQMGPAESADPPPEG